MGSHILLLHQNIMEAIKKKMQAMKVEKDNAMDLADEWETKSKVAKARAEKSEEELEEREAALNTAELEVRTLDARVQTIEGDLEISEEKMVTAVAKLDKASTATDDSERMRKVME